MARCACCGRAMHPQCLYCAVCGARMRPSLAVGSVVAERYLVGAVLSQEGRHLLSYLVKDQQSGQYQVLKEVRDDLRTAPPEKQAFQAALKALGTLVITGIAPVRNYVAHAGRHYLVLDYIQGKTLRAILAQQPSLSDEQALSLLKAVLGILAHMQERPAPLVHGDLRPDNLLLAGWEKVTLLDGAWLKALGNPYEHQAPYFKADYAAPEVLKGTLTPAGDLYALALTLLEATTGTPASELYDAPANGLKWPPLRHPLLQQILSRMVEGPLHSRFSSATQVLQALAAGAVPPPASSRAAVPDAPSAPSAPPAAAPSQAPKPSIANEPRPSEAAPLASELVAPQTQSLEAERPTPAPADLEGVPATSQDGHAEDGLEALMALYELQNS